MTIRDEAPSQPPQASAGITELKGFDHALFTGGTEIGRKIMAGAAGTLTPVTLELGGKSPVIVAADADLDVVARRVAWVKLMNSGQTCIAPDYVLVENPVKDALTAKIVAAFHDFRAGEPRFLRVVNPRQFDRIAGYLEATRGHVIAGGGFDRDTVSWPASAWALSLSSGAAARTGSPQAPAPEHARPSSEERMPPTSVSCARGPRPRAQG